MNRRSDIEGISVTACHIPTEQPEADGTLEWDATGLVVVEAEADGRRGLGYSYTHPAAAALIRDQLAPLVTGRDALSPRSAWQAMLRKVRNVGRPGLASAAISAVDTALWDLKARLLDLPLVTLFGQVRASVPIYGSGGFTSYSEPELREQLGEWSERGITRVKMKVGADPATDPARVEGVRAVIGPDVELFVDANGAYARKQALEMAERFADFGVNWFEEPVSSDDLEGLRLLRDRAPAGMEIAAGEYGYTPDYFLRMLAAGAVDVLQADATRCGGYSGFLMVDAITHASGIALSTHTAPALHLPIACCATTVRHMEWFHDHVRIEKELFEGFVPPETGRLAPVLSRPGNGLAFRRDAAERYQLRE